MSIKEKNIIIKEDIFPEYKEVHSKINLFCELLNEVNEIQKYLNKFGFNIDVQINEKDLSKVD